MIVGGMASGKTTTAEFLVNNYGFTLISLASPIKHMEQLLADGMEVENIVSTLFTGFLTLEESVTMHQILNETKLIPRELPKPRKRLQFLGTDGVRTRIRDTFWLEYAHARASKFQNVVVDDVRFPNEYVFFKELGWKAIGLYVTPEIQKQRVLQLYGSYDPSLLEHPSEKNVNIILEKEHFDLKINTAETNLNEHKKLLQKETALWA